MNSKSIFINALAVVVAVIVGWPLGKFVQGKSLANGGPPHTQPLAEDVASQQFNDLGVDYLVLGNTRCIYCKEGVQLLDELGAKYRVIYLDKEPKNRVLLDKLGATGVPIIMSRKEFVVGFEKRVWTRLLEAKTVGAAN